MVPKSVLQIFYYSLWYALLVMCNIYTKLVLQAFPYPCTVSASTLGMGLLYILPVWGLGLRPRPKVTRSHLKSLLPIAVFHSLGVAMTHVSLQAGPVSLTNTIKITEPVFSTIFFAAMKTFEPMWVNLSLVPIIGGVVVACVPTSSDASLQYCCVTAVGANASFAVRGVLSKTHKMQASKQDYMTPANVFAVIIILSFCLMFPVAFLLEGAMVRDGLESAYGVSVDKYAFQSQMLIAGFTYYLCNEVAYLVRGFQSNKNAPYINAVGDTAKRAIVIVAGALFFSDDPITGNMMFGVGSCMALLGHLVYSWYRARFAVTKKAKPPTRRRESISDEVLKPRKLNFDKSPNLKREERIIKNNNFEDGLLAGKPRRRSLSIERFRKRRSRKGSEDSASIISTTRSMYESGSSRRRTSSKDYTVGSVGGMRSIQEQSKNMQTPRKRTRSFERFRRKSSSRAEI